MNANVLKKIRRICLALPDTVETETWGKPHFRVNNKIFAGCGDENGRPVVGFKLTSDHAKAIVQTPGFSVAPYVGHKGWVSMDASIVTDKDLISELILESYQLIAPKRSLAKLDALDTDVVSTKRPGTGTRKKAVKKTAKASGKKSSSAKKKTKKKK